MTKYYLLTIPIAIGIVTGAFLAFYPESESNLLTTAKLINGGSPIMGDSDAPKQF